MFELDKEQSEKLDKWLKTEIYPPIVARQKASGMGDYIMTDDEGNEYPYEGAAGGGLTFMFTPTSIGLITRVMYAGDPERTIDLSDYDMW